MHVTVETLFLAPTDTCRAGFNRQVWAFVAQNADILVSVKREMGTVLVFRAGVEAIAGAVHRSKRLQGQKIKI